MTIVYEREMGVAAMPADKEWGLKTSIIKLNLPFGSTVISK